MPRLVGINLFEVSIMADETPGTTGQGQPNIPDELLQRFGGAFSADLADLMANFEPKPARPSAAPPPLSIRPEPEPQSAPEPIDTWLYDLRQFAQAYIRHRKVEEAIAFMLRHAPEDSEWLTQQVERSAPRLLGKITNEPETDTSETPITIIPDATYIDTEMGRLAVVLGQVPLFRAWAIAQGIDDGDGWIERDTLERLWRAERVGGSPRHLRRIIQHGVEHGYWTYDKETKRIYLTGQVKLGKRLVQAALAAGYGHILETNLPGRKRVSVDLAGSIQQVAANLYGAWLSSKDRDGSGVMISRDTLMLLWNVSTPTLRAWEKALGIARQFNYAQTDDPSLENVPAHAYLIARQDGTYGAGWRLPNRYFVKSRKIKEHPNVGKSRRVRKVARGELTASVLRGSDRDAALPRTGKLYFAPDDPEKDAFKACESYVRRLSRKGGNVFQRRYFCLGWSNHVRIFEPYDVETRAPQTTIWDRDLGAEETPEFAALAHEYASLLAV